MTNQEKFIEVFGVGTWRKLIRSSETIKEFKNFWMSKYDKQKGARKWQRYHASMWGGVL